MKIRSLNFSLIRDYRLIISRKSHLVEKFERFILHSGTVWNVEFPFKFFEKVEKQNRLSENY